MSLVNSLIKLVPEMGMPVLFRMKVVPLVLLLAVVFAFLLNWPVLLHFYDILSHLEHVKIGFVISGTNFIKEFTSDKVYLLTLI